MSEADHSRVHPELEFWAAVLSSGPTPLASDKDLGRALDVARQCLTQTPLPRVSCLAYYVLGKVVLLQRRQYPQWQSWVPYAAMFAGENAAAAQDPVLRRLCISLLEEFVRCMKEATGHDEL